MSEFNVVVVQLPERIGKHPNADTLSICQVNGKYPVIFKTGDFEPGGKAVYIPVDSVVDTSRPEFNWLDRPRVKAKKLRGIFSMGFLVPASNDWDVGQVVAHELGVTKYEEPVLSATHGANVDGPTWLPWAAVYDLEAVRKYGHVLKQGEPVIVTEKVHGTNARFAFSRGELHVGSHKCWKKLESSRNVWWEVAERYKLAERFAAYEDHIFYGEIFGWVQDLRYGAKPGETWLRLFDIRGNDGRWLEYDRVVAIANELGIPPVPHLYRGPYSDAVLELCNGDTTLDAGHMREGIVIQADPERYDEIGRVKLKHVSEAYLLRKEGESPIMKGAKHRR